MPYGAPSLEEDPPIPGYDPTDPQALAALEGQGAALPPSDDVMAMAGAVPQPGAGPDDLAAPAYGTAPPLPVPGQAVPGAPPVPGPLSTAQASADVTKAAGEAHDARSEADKATEAALVGAAPGVDAQKVAADQRAAVAAEHIAQEKAIQAKYDAADAKAEQQYAQTQAALKKFKFRDYWADKSIAQRVLAALSTAIGAFGAGLAKTPNYALQILDKQMDDDHKLQVANLQQLSDEEVMDRTGMTDVRAARGRALADITLGDAAKDRLIAAQLEQAAARSKDANYQNTVTAQVTKLRADSAEKDMKAKEILRNNALGDETAAANAADKQALANLHNAQAAAGGFSRGRGHAGAGGGGGRGAALSAFTAAALDGHTSEADLASMGLHAGLKPNQVSAEVARIRKERSGGATGASGLGSDRLLSKEAESWAKANGVADINKKQRELSAVLDEVNNAPHNPLQQALAIEKAVSSARGGAASKQALQLALHHLGGKWDSIQALIQGAQSGEVGEAQMKNFVGFMTNQLGTAQKEGKDKYDDFNKYVASQPAGVRERLLAERGRIFSGLHGFGEGGGASRDEGKIGRAKAAIASPNASPAAKEGAAAYLRSQGVSP